MLQIFINLVRVKLIAIFVGVSGMGEFALFNSTLNTINFIVGLGLSYSATRLISQNKDFAVDTINKIYKIVSYWLILPSIVGTIFLILFSRYLSTFYFHNNSKAISIALLSATVSFTAYAGRNNIFLQGMGKYKDLALSSLVGSILGLLISIPLFYFLKLNAVVPSIIFSSALAYFCSKYYFSKSIEISKYSIKIIDVYNEGKDMVFLGLVMMAASLFGSLVTNLVNIYITHNGSLTDLGLYNAGYNISIQYVALIFTAMSTEFFPRLSSVSHDEIKVSDMVNQQTEIALLILLPILTIMVISSPLIIKFVLSNDFKLVIPFIRIISFSLIFQALAYTISNIPIAKGEKQTFFIYNSILPGISAVMLLILGYKYFGLLGIAIGIVGVNFLHFICMFIVCNHKYNFKMSSNVKLFSIITFVILIMTNVALLNFQSFKLYLTISLLLIFSIFFSLFHLNKLLELNELWKKYIFNNLKK